MCNQCQLRTCEKKHSESFTFGLIITGIALLCIGLGICLFRTDMMNDIVTDSIITFCLFGIFSVVCFVIAAIRHYHQKLHMELFHHKNYEIGKDW